MIIIAQDAAPATHYERVYIRHLHGYPGDRNERECDRAEGIDNDDDDDDDRAFNDADDMFLAAMIAKYPNLSIDWPKDQ